MTAVTAEMREQFRMDLESEVPAMTSRELRFEMLYLDRSDPLAEVRFEVVRAELRRRRSRGGP